MLRFTKILKIRKTQLALAIILALGFFLVPTHGVHAGSIWDIVEKTASDTISGVLFGVINSILSIIVSVLGLMLGAIATMADSVMQPVAITTNATVQLGWGITRDFANMFFILILLGIALDFIMFNSFKVKQMIPRLILVALLINFSLPIAGVLIDFANVFTQFFLSQASEGAGLTGKIANDLNIQKVLDVTVKNLGTGNVGDLQWNLFKTLLFGILFMFGTAFVLLVLALMFIVRTGYLYMLLIILPLVLVLSAFPPTSSHWNKWTSSFIKWVMFAPIATFFLYFAVLMFHELIGKNIAVVSSDTFITSFYKYVIVWVFLLGAITAAQSMGGKAAGMAMGAAGWVKGKIIRGLKRGGTAGLTEAGRRMGADAQMEKLASNIQKAVPGWIGGSMLASGVRGLGAKTKMAMEKREEPSAAEKAKWSSMSDSALAQEQAVYEKSLVPGSGAAAAHIAAIRAKKGKLKVLDPSGTVDVARTETLVRSSYEAAKKSNNKAAMDAILQSSPLTARVIRQEEWDKDKLEGKTVTATDIKTGNLTQKNRETGKTLADVQRDVFDISRADFGNMKGQWDENNVKEFIESGHLTRTHLREAVDISDGPFTNFVAKYYSDIDGMASGPTKQAAIDNIKKLNPALTNAYIAGNLTEVGLGKPTTLTDWQ